MATDFHNTTQQTYPAYLLKLFGDSYPPAVRVWLEISKLVIRLKGLTGDSVGLGTWCPGCNIVLKAIQHRLEKACHSEIIL
jgi:hypothetical protein